VLHRTNRERSDKLRGAEVELDGIFAAQSAEPNEPPYSLRQLAALGGLSWIAWSMG
jgi:hypothetical protein